MEPQTSFFHAALKVHWAGILLDRLSRAANMWVETKPCAVWPDYDPKTDTTRIMSGIKDQLDAGFALAAGDIVANLRSALDCAWMGLVRAAGGKDKRTLPIADNRKGLVNTIAKSPVKASLHDAVALLADDLGAHRDFDNGGSRPLAFLNDLSNWQKHNLLVATPMATIGNKIQISTTKCTNIKIAGNQTVGRVAMDVFTLAGKVTEFEQEGEPTSEILISGEKIADAEPLIPTLVQFREVAAKALKSFATRFPAGDSPEFRSVIG